MNLVAPIPALQQRIKELEAENAKLRPQLDAANGTEQNRTEQNSYDRQNERSTSDIVGLFEVKTGMALSEVQGWEFMICLKEVRLQRQQVNGGDRGDTLKDLRGHHALKAECLTEK